MPIAIQENVMTSRTFKKFVKLTLVGYGLVLLPWVIVTNLSQQHGDAEEWTLEEHKNLTKKYRNMPTTNRSVVQICLERAEGREGQQASQIVLVGDSRMRQIYKAFVKLVSDGSEPEDYAKETEREHSTLSFEHDRLTIDFYWAPEPKNIIDIYKFNLSSPPPSVIIMGCGIHSMLDSSLAVTVQSSSPQKKLQIYSKHLRTIRSLSDGFASTTAQFWFLQPGVQTSLLGSDLKRNGPSIGNSLIKLFNLSADTEFKIGGHVVVLWKRMAEIAKTTTDGLHLNVDSLKASNQMILNVLCQKDLVGSNQRDYKWLINQFVSEKNS